MSILDPAANYERSQSLVGYVPRSQATEETYAQLGFRCGLEIHQQLKTAKKLFCRCPAGRYQNGENDYDAELVRHMRPTLSELGEYDGTALMEFKTKKNIIYRIKGESACTYDIDDTPPFPLNREALAIAVEAALLLKTNIVGELHITRKQYLDGSIPTGFQRTAIVGIEGEIPLANKAVRIIQLSVEEDSCREVADIGHERTYTTDRLGIPLIETVTYPDMTTPDEAEEVGQYLRFVARSTGKVNTGIGAARQDVNVSVNGGTRVEIKGVSRLRLIPELTHNEAFRQKALLEIRQVLCERVRDPDKWTLRCTEVEWDQIEVPSDLIDRVVQHDLRLLAINLPSFGGILSYFTQPGRGFADELSDRLKVIACLDEPNMAHSEDSDPTFTQQAWAAISALLDADSGDAQLLVWGPHADMQTAQETVEERCRLVFAGVPNETRKALPDGTTIFERVLPGPDRMYPDTDSAPIPIDDTLIESIRATLPADVSEQIAKMAAWKVPKDARRTLLRRNLVPLVERLSDEGGEEPAFVATLLAHTLRRYTTMLADSGSTAADRLCSLVTFLRQRDLDRDILKAAAPAALSNPTRYFESILAELGYQPLQEENILERIPALSNAFDRQTKTDCPRARRDWIMGQLRPLALGNMRLARLARAIEEEAP